MPSAGTSAQSLGDGKLNLNPLKRVVAGTIDTNTGGLERTVSIDIEGTILTIPADYAEAYITIRAQLLASFRAMTLNAATPADFSIVFGAPTVITDQNPPQDTAVTAPPALVDKEVALPANISKGKEVVAEAPPGACAEAWTNARAEQPAIPSKAKAKDRAADTTKLTGSKRPRTQKSDKAPVAAGSSKTAEPLEAAPDITPPTKRRRISTGVHKAPGNVDGRKSATRGINYKVTPIDYNKVPLAEDDPAAFHYADSVLPSSPDFDSENMYDSGLSGEEYDDMEEE